MVLLALMSTHLPPMPVIGPTCCPGGGPQVELSDQPLLPVPKLMVKALAQL